MTSFSFPDVNVWLALALEHHVHRFAARAWWNQGAFDRAGFTRVTQLSLLRLLTTAAAMDGQPLTMEGAWEVYDEFLTDDRVALFAEPAGFDARLRERSVLAAASPKAWADAYLLAFAAGHQGQVVTFDRALESRGAGCLVLR
jgi:uncharacterized protein